MRSIFDLRQYGEKYMKQNLFEHSVDYYLHNNKVIGLIPSMDKAFVCKETIINYPSKVISSQKPLFHSSYIRKKRIKRVFVLTSACNLQCTYCFEGNDHAIENIDITAVRLGIHEMFKEASLSGKKIISLSLFGGEPTINWKAVEVAVEMAQQLEAETGIRCYKAIVTNGVMPIDHAKYLAQNLDFIYFSFDGPKQLFLQQRKPKGGSDIYDVIFRNAKEIYQSGAYLSFKITVTSRTIDFLKEIDDFFAYHFPTCGRLYQPCMVNEIDDLFISFGEFLEKYYQLQKYSIFKKTMTTSLYKNQPSDRFCNLAIRNVVYPDGSVLACHRSNMCIPEDEVKSVFTVGHCGKNGVIYRDEKQEKQMESFTVSQISECNRCSLRYHCCGGCATIKLLSGNHDMFRKADYCDDFRKYTFTILCERLLDGFHSDSLMNIPEQLEHTTLPMAEMEFNAKVVEKMINIEE